MSRTVGEVLLEWLPPIVLYAVAVGLYRLAVGPWDFGNIAAFAGIFLAISVGARYTVIVEEAKR